MRPGGRRPWFGECGFGPQSFPKPGTQEISKHEYNFPCAGLFPKAAPALGHTGRIE